MATSTKQQKRARMTSLQKAIYYNDLITSNKAMFKAGSKFNSTQLYKLLKLTPPASNDYVSQHKFKLKLTHHTIKINSLLALRGLRIASKHYYSEFEVVKKPKVKVTVTNYENKSKIMDNTAHRLERGAAIYKSNWRALGPVELQRVAKWIKDPISYSV